MPTLDTNALLRWVLADVPEQAAAVDHLLASGHRFLVPDAALIEFGFVLERVKASPRSIVARAIETTLAQSCIDADRQRWRQTIGFYLKHPKLSLADTYLAATAEQTSRTPLLTFDKKLANQLPVAELISAADCYY